MRKRVSTPKQASAKPQHYKYYAGFSHAFVSDILHQYTEKDARVLDPWNGSGMTTWSCAKNGIASVGLDVNPAMLPVAWARLARPDLVARLCDRLKTSVQCSTFRSTAPISTDDLHGLFFTPNTSKRIIALRQLLIDTVIGMQAELNEGDQERSALAGAAFLILTKVLRELLAPFRGTNPSWFSIRKAKGSKLSVDAAALKKLSILAIEETKFAASFRLERGPEFKWPKILTADSKSDMSDLGQFDLILTSPPYATRIDYAIATTPEIVALGTIGTAALSALRAQMIGTVVTNSSNVSHSFEQNPILNASLSAIEKHSTKAASTYYLRYFTTYFRDLCNSLDRIAPVVKPDGTMVVVVQNSYFKEVELDLTGIVSEHVNNLGFSLVVRDSHRMRPNLAGSNSRFKKYRTENVKEENVLIFQRKEGKRK